MKIKTNGLIGTALDWVVVECEHAVKRYKYGSPVFNQKTKRVYETQGLEQIGVNFAPSTDWAQGGPIIEREGITWVWEGDLSDSEDRIYEATDWATGNKQEGPTPLIATMRCYVASKLGDEIDIPDELLPTR